MSSETITRLIDAMATTIESHTAQLTRLDQEIGDGDHGTNMARGFAELRAQREAIAALPLGEALKKAGMVLVTKVGGASGPLYGTLLIDMGKAAPDHEPSLDELSSMLDAGIKGVKARGKADIKMKTMLDVLCPVADALRTAVEQGRTEQIDRRLLAAAAHALHATSYMEAKRGRASFLGERSKGHIDPGACSSALLIGAVISVLQDDWVPPADPVRAAEEDAR